MPAPTTEELLKQADAFNEAEKCQEVVDLLPDALLEERQSAELYTERARAHSFLMELEKQWIYCEKAISLNANYYKEYNYRGNYWRNKGEYDKALADFNRAIELKPDYAIAHNNRGLAWDDKGEYDKALVDYDRAIELNPDDAGAFYSRGIAWAHKKEYDRAIIDFDKTIIMKPDYSNAFIWRGLVWASKGEYDKAIADYDRAIALKPDDAIAYNNRGNAWGDKGEDDKAIANYDRAIELNSDDADAYNNRGVSWKNKGELEKAISDYEIAIQKDPKAKCAHMNLGDIYYDKEDYEKALEYYKASLKEDKKNYYYVKNRIENINARLDKKEQELNSAAEFIMDIIQQIENKERKKAIRNKSLDMLDAMNGLRSHAHISNPQPVVHYTKLTVAELFVNNLDSNLRFYNVLYMNDPEEGKVLLDYLDKETEKISTGIGQCFQDGRQTPDGDNNIYLGSFLPAPQHDNIKYSHEDELVLWRTYGKNETGEEARGSSLVIDGDFFSGDNDYVQHEVAGNKDGVDALKKHTLYQVLYLDKRNGDVVMNDVSKAKKVKDDLAKLKSSTCQLMQLGESDEEKIIINQVVYRVLSELRYFFKSADYSFENECRVIKYARPDHERVTIDETCPKPKKLFYAPEVQIQPHIKKIIIGPRVPGGNEWKIYLDVSIAQNKKKPEFKDLLKDIEVRKSATKFV